MSAKTGNVFKDDWLAFVLSVQPLVALFILI